MDASARAATSEPSRATTSVIPAAATVAEVNRSRAGRVTITYRRGSYERSWTFFRSCSTTSGIACFIRDSSQCSILISRTGRGRGHGRRALLLLQQALLAEDVAGPEVGEVLALALDLDRAVLDDVEVVRVAALADDRLALGDRLRGSRRSPPWSAPRRAPRRTGGCSSARLRPRVSLRSGWSPGT